MSNSQDHLYIVEFHLKEFLGATRVVQWVSSTIQNEKVDGRLRPFAIEIFRDVLHEALSVAERVWLELRRVMANIASHVDESRLKSLYAEIASCELMLVEGAAVLAEISSMPLVA